MGSKFTPEEQARISARIKEGIVAGQPRDRAIAAAVAEVAPSKSLASARPLPINYSVSKIGDKFLVRGLPIFAEHDRAGIGSFDLLSLLHYSDVNKVQASEGYAPPANFKHNIRGEPPAINIGLWKNISVGPAIMEGKPRYVAYADVMVDSREDVELLAAKYRYRSVEIPPGLDEISALAFLSAQPSWLKFPIPRLVPDSSCADEEFHFAPVAPDASGPLAWRKHPAGVSVLYQMPEFSVTYDEEAVVPEPKKSVGYQPPPDVAEKLKAAFEVCYAAVLEAIGGEAAPAEPGKPADQPVADMTHAQAAAPIPTVAPAVSATPDALKYAALQGELAAEKAKNAAAEKSAAEKADLDGAMDRVRKSGRFLGNGWENEVKTYAAQGPAVLTAYLDAALKYNAALPGAAPPAETAAPKIEIPELAKYAAQGPDVLEVARSYAALYQSPEGVALRGLPLDRFLAASVGGINGARV